ncbi:hypothetical protein NDU88_003344 [Pleurodeles waltl]|uniref:Uncharacterized protein n=1 Tax=Pleurodeles waltl TaxID=8319 RepID=A0AAV7QCP7_PLEWA|nr:hypothetical protein NDU88_003344 [Pleurodeles waltl]
MINSSRPTKRRSTPGRRGERQRLAAGISLSANRSGMRLYRQQQERWIEPPGDLQVPQRLEACTAQPQHVSVRRAHRVEANTLQGGCIKSPVKEKVC